MANTTTIIKYFLFGMAVSFEMVTKINCENQIDFYDLHYLNYWIHGSARITTSCENMPYIPDKARRDNRVDTKYCVVLYDQADCKGTQKRLEAGNHKWISNWMDRTQSYRPCADLSRGYPWKDLRVKFFQDNYAQIAADSPIEPYCKNIPDMYKNTISSLITPICIIIFTQPNCEGLYQFQQKGQSSSLGKLNDKVRSFRPCSLDDLKKTVKLKAKAIKFESPTSGLIRNVGSIQTSVLNIQKAINNASIEITTIFSHTTTISDIFEVGVGKALTNIYEIDVKDTASFNLSATTDGITPTNLAASLRAGYKYHMSNMSYFKNKKEQFQEKQVSIQKTMPVPPCSQIEIKWIAKRRKGALIRFIVTLEVSGEVDQVKMKASDVKMYLQNGATYLRDKDAFTIIVKVEEEVKADYVSETYLLSNVASVDNCVKANPLFDKTKVTFYGKENYKESLFTANLTDYCQTVPKTLNGRIRSIRNNQCIMLFSSERCKYPNEKHQYAQNFFIKLNPGVGLALSTSFTNGVSSMITCKGYETEQTLRNRHLRVRFFNEMGITSISELPLFPSCKNFAGPEGKKLSSVQSDDCIILFSEVSCTGNNFTVVQQSTPMHLRFTDRILSFRACSKIEKGQYDYKESFLISHKNNAKIKLYKDVKFQNIILDTNILPTCNTPEVHVRNAAASIKTDICVVIYTEPYCQGRSSILEPGGSLHQSFIYDLESFRPCNSADLFEYSHYAYIVFIGATLLFLITLIIISVVLVRKYGSKILKRNRRYVGVPTISFQTNNLNENNEQKVTFVKNI